MNELDKATRDLRWSHRLLTVSLWAMLVPLILGAVIAVAAGVWVFLSF